MIWKPLVSRAGLALAALFAFVATTAEARQSISLNTGWRFFQGGLLSGAETAGFDDSGWQQVQVPHTWNRIGEYKLQRSFGQNNFQGVGWYRLSFNAPQLATGQRAYLQFDGVGNIAEVWVNGTKAGRHEGAFSRFRFDVTALVKSGAANLVTVRADNSRRAEKSVTGSIIPLAGDFFVNGGIYRDVSLVVTDGPAYIDLADFGGPGIYARATGITPAKASVEVLSRLRNDGAARPLTLTARIRDAAGRQVATTQQQVQLAAGGSEVKSSLTLPKPRLWNGRADPYLYTITVELAEGGKPVDSVTQPLGIRSFRVDPNQGFFLNGKHLSLYGVSRHQDRQGKGWALSDSDHEEDMAMIAEIGANTVRGAHYQHAQKWYDLTDRYGMVVWAEIPVVNMTAWNSDRANEKLTANARQQLTELIRQAYNHPSIVTWSIGNEADVGARPMQTETQSAPLLRELHALAKAEDPSRLTSYADCCEDAPYETTRKMEDLSGVADLHGYNRYFGWYYGKNEELGPTLDQLHAKHPNLPISVSEYGAGGALSQHSDDPKGGVLDSNGRPHPEEYQSRYHEENWRQIAARPYLWASWVWNMFDFPSDFRAEGEAVDLNDKGLVSFDRTQKKDAFFFYKAHWNPEPMVYITGRRYVDRAYPATEIRVYSNAPSVKLALNGTDLGTVQCQNRVCVLPSVRLVAGDNKVTASATVAGKTVTDSVNWTGPNPEAGVRIDAGAMVGRVGADGKRVGSDAFFTGGEAKRLNAVSLLNRQTGTRSVSGTGDAAYFQDFRVGRTRYAIPLPNGRWKVTVLSAEPDDEQAGKRSFDISANGAAAVKGWSPAKAAGGAFKTASVQFDAEVKDGVLNLAFDPAGGEPVIAGIEVSR